MIIKIINCPNGSGKPRKVYIVESSDPEKFRRILRQSEYLYDFLGDKLPVTSRTRVLRKSRNQEMT